MEIKKTNHNNILFTLAVLIVLSAIAIGFFLLTGSNSDNKKEYEAKNSKEVDQITEIAVKEIEKIDTQEILAGNTESYEAVILPKDEMRILDQEIAKLDDIQKQELLKILAENYSSIMIQQKSEALRILEDLVMQGKAEWETLVANGENTPIVKGEKISEYLAMINVMEKNMDESIEIVLQKMEEQLKEAEIEATPIINQYRDKYEAIKEENRQIMMDKALETIKS